MTPKNFCILMINLASPGARLHAPSYAEFRENVEDLVDSCLSDAPEDSDLLALADAALRPDIDDVGYIKNYFREQLGRLDSSSGGGYTMTDLVLVLAPKDWARVTRKELRRLLAYPGKVYVQLDLASGNNVWVEAVRDSIIPTLANLADGELSAEIVTNVDSEIAIALQTNKPGLHLAYGARH